MRSVAFVLLDEADMLAYFESSLGWKEILTRTLQRMWRDDAQALAAQLSYYFFLALFPALLCLIAFASFFPLQHLTEDMVRLLGPFAPAEVLDLLKQQMMTIAEGRHGGLLSLGLLGAIWSSSSAMLAVVSAMNRAYEIGETRPWWNVRVTAIFLTIALALFIVIAFTLIVAGPQLADFLGRHLGFGAVFVWTWKILQWPLAFLLVTTGLGLIYYYAPDADQEWVWITPGAVTAAALWFMGSLLFRVYAVNFGHYQATYGAIGGMILLLLWFFLSGLVIVIGAEMNAEIEHASPWGKAPGEQTPGHKKRLGVAAARHYRWHGQTPAVWPPRTRLALPAYEAPSLIERLASYMVVCLLCRRPSKS
jgi:membrane protein